MNQEQRDELEKLRAEIQDNKTREKGISEEKEKLAQENKELREENNRLKNASGGECSQTSQISDREKKELKKENSELKAENGELKTENGKLKDNNSLQTENTELKKDNDILKTENGELKTENDRLKKQGEHYAQKTKEDQKTIEQLRGENEKLKQKKPSQPETSQSDLDQFTYDSCPSIQGRKATVFGVTYEAFCGAAPRGRSVDESFRTSNPKYCMGACSIDRSCQGAFFEFPSTCYLRIDHDYPPRRGAGHKDMSLIPIVPREGGIGAPTPDIPSRLIKDGWVDRNLGCPDTDGTVVSVGSYQFRLNCKEYKPRKVLQDYQGVQTISGIFAACALNPACQGISNQGNLVQIAEHEGLPERSGNSELKSSYWVMMLTQARNSAQMT
jgi:hypothetical protein